MDHNSGAVISEVIAKLQGLIGSSPVNTPTKLSAATIPEFDENMTKCLDKAKSVAPELFDLTSIYKEATDMMKTIMGYSKTNKKFSPVQEEKLKQKLMGISQKINAVQQKNHQFSDHCRTFREIMQTTLWVFISTPEFLFKGSVESADFWALKFMKKKNPGHNQWYKLFQISVNSLEKYVMAEYVNGLIFNFNGVDKWDSLIEGQIAPPPAQETLKQTVKQQEVQVAPVKKIKKKEMVGLTCTLSHYDNEEVVFKSEEIQMKHSIFIQNSKHLQLKIEGKCKSIVISRCEDITLDLKSCVSGVEVINCKGVKVWVRERTPSFSADTSESVSLILNHQNLECDIVSSKTSELSISYRNDDGSESKACPVSSQLLTKWDPISKQFKTSVYDQFL